MEEAEASPYQTEFERKQISQVVRTMLQGTNGDMWFGTQDGLCRYDGTSLVYYDLRDEYGQGVTVTAIVEDRDDNMWFGTTGGVTKFDGGSFTTFTTEDGLTSNYVWSMCVDDADVVWVGTYDGVCHFDGKTFAPFPIPASTKKDAIAGPTSPTIVWCVTQDTAGNMWFVGEGTVYRYDGESVSSISVMDQMSDTFVRSLRSDKSGDIWFSTRYKGLIRFDGKEFVNVAQQEGLSGIEFGGMFEDSSGDLWFTAENVGVFRYDGNSFTKVLEKDVVGSRAAHCIAEDRDGRLWFGGWMGAYRYDGESVVNVTREGPW